MILMSNDFELHNINANARKMLYPRMKSSQEDELFELTVGHTR